MADDDYLYSDLFQPNDGKPEAVDYGDDMHGSHSGHGNHGHSNSMNTMESSSYMDEPNKRSTDRHSSSSKYVDHRGHSPASRDYRDTRLHTSSSYGSKRSKSKDRHEFKRSRSRSPTYKKLLRSRSRSHSPSSRDYYRRKKTGYLPSTGRHTEHDLEAQCDDHLRKGLGSLWDDWQKHRKLCAMSQTRFIRHLLSLHKKFCVSRPNLADCGTQYDPIDQQIALTPGPYAVNQRPGVNAPQQAAITNFPQPVTNPAFQQARLPNQQWQPNMLPQGNTFTNQPPPMMPTGSFPNRMPGSLNPPPPIQTAAAMFNNMVQNNVQMNRQPFVQPNMQQPPPMQNPQFNQNNNQMRMPNQMMFNTQTPQMAGNRMMNPMAGQTMNQPMMGQPMLGQQMTGQPGQQGMQTGQQGQQKTAFYSLSKNPVVKAFETGERPNLTIDDLKGNFIDFSHSQQGAKFLQEKLNFATPQQLEFIFAEVFENPTNPKTIMMNPFGNYVIQILLEKANMEQKNKFIEAIRGSVIEMCSSKNGNRVVQKMFEVLDEMQKVEIAQEMKNNCVMLAKGYNGGFVIQKCLSSIDSAHIPFVVQEFTGKELELATDSQGCRVMQSFIEHFQVQQKEGIINVLLKEIEMLAMDRFGNYVIQYIMKFGQPAHQSAIVAVLKEKVSQFATNKYSSNVLENCLNDAGPHDRATLIDEVCNMEEKDFLGMLQDNFANYVINKMLDVADPLQRRDLMQRIKPHAEGLATSKQCNKIIAKMNAYFQQESS